MERDLADVAALNAPRRACVRGGRSKDHDDATTGTARRAARVRDDVLDVRGAVGVVGDRGAVTRFRGSPIKLARTATDWDQRDEPNSFHVDGQDPVVATAGDINSEGKRLRPPRGYRERYVRPRNAES